MANIHSVKINMVKVHKKASEMSIIIIQICAKSTKFKKKYCNFYLNVIYFSYNEMETFPETFPKPFP